MAVELSGSKGLNSGSAVSTEGSPALPPPPCHHIAEAHACAVPLKPSLGLHPHPLRLPHPGLGGQQWGVGSLILEKFQGLSPYLLLQPSPR